MKQAFGLGTWLALLVALAFGSVLTGCLSRPRLERHTFALEPVAATNNVSSQSQAVLAIRTLEVSPLFETSSFVYRTGANRFQVDPYAGFLIAPARALALPMRSYLRSSGAFKDVVEPGSQLGADTFLEVYVMELYGDLRPGGPPAAVLSMRLLFFSAEGAKARQPFLEKQYARRVPLHGRSAAALAAGWNQALAQTMKEVTADLETSRGQNARAP